MSNVQKYGVFGDPIHHSLSPVMHNAAFSNLGIPAVYEAFLVKPGDLEHAVLKAKDDGFRGLNITIPHKESVLKFDFISPDPFSKMVGAANTLRFLPTGIEAFNTDAMGALLALESENCSTDGKNILVIGAGGASRSISFLFGQRQNPLKIINRTAEKAEKLAAEISGKTGNNVSAGGFSNLLDDVEWADIIIQTTELGMGKYESVSVFDQTESVDSDENLRNNLLKKYLTPNTVVFDIVYNPKETKFLKEARTAGAKTINGTMMLVYQGALAFELWTGQKPDVSVMKDAVLKALDAKQNEK
ncbi:Shikimate dehydrogenase (NADP(+)) [Methanosarcinaceae archaeon Ag5]|uniref:Shikimate dehydrogenase (NADP(+)) n=1 Tax=Methanolapillus africanus TaxID=3028297 RepID=A0AAE4SDQ8_9EURY|nr:Shikimate dehydrogenase (NADP(+)) [Methanosarcinaceae archaeon Ag5]